MTVKVLAVANGFAAALDAEDYSSAHALLAPDCVYQIRNETLTGADVIIDSYRENGATAKRRFDALEYMSEVQATGESTAVILFIDRVRLQDQWHEYRCRQHLTVGIAGQIVEIRHEELPGERERLQAFESR